MKWNLLIAVALVSLTAALVLPSTAYADAPAPQNQVTLDITINETGEMSVGGLSMTQMGLGRIDDQAKGIFKDLDSAHLVLQGELVTVDVHGTPVLKMQWNPTSRQVLATVATRYGVQLTADLQTRIEEWVSSSNIDVTARYSNEASKPLVAKMPKPVLVDLGAEGQVTVEKMPLAYGIDPGVFQYIKMSGVQNAIMCWNKGTLNPKADGKDLPSITLYPKGVQFLSQALHLNIENSLEPFFGSQVGADVTLPGGAHQAGTTCKYD